MQLIALCNKALQLSILKVFCTDEDMIDETPKIDTHASVDPFALRCIMPVFINEVLVQRITAP